MRKFALLVGVALSVGISSSACGQTPYDVGRADRSTYERWFGQQHGDARDGAEFWAGQRSAPRPTTCGEPPGMSQSWRAGCEAARSILSPFDNRRRENAEYRRGWNAPVSSGSGEVGARASAPLPITRSAPAEEVAAARSADPYEAAREYRDLLANSGVVLELARAMMLCGFRDPAWERRVQDRTYYVAREFASNSLARSTNPVLLRRLVESLWAEHMARTNRPRMGGMAISECLDIQGNAEVARILDEAAASQSAAGASR